MATRPAPAQPASEARSGSLQHRGPAINSDSVRKPIIRPSRLGEFESPQVGELEVATRGIR
jgi:hypothetical protein